MKKSLVLALIGTIFLFSSCEEAKLYTVLIKNESSKPVSYEYDGASNTLATNASKFYEVMAYTQPPKKITVTGAMSVKMDRAGDTFTFVNAEEITLNVTNQLSFSIKLKADNYIDDNGSTEIEVTSDTTKTAKIFTVRPNFTTVPSSCTVKWEFDKDDKNKMNVTIQ